MVIIIFYLQWHTGVDEETFKYVSIKIAPTTLLKKFTILNSTILNFLFSNLETGRCGQKSGVSRLSGDSGFSGRVDSNAI